jgi:hypothetical protein
MIMEIENHAKNQPLRLFEEWASNFSEGLFMTLKLYADESGIHSGAKVVVLAGLIESREYWQSFNHRWKGVLDNHAARYFHYREFRENAAAKQDSQYYGWSKEKRKNFIYRLAMLTGESAVPVGGGSRVERKFDSGANLNPFEQAIRNFYESTIKMLNLHWPKYDGKVLIILDNCDEKEWTGPLHQIHTEYKNKDSRIGGLSFEDDKDPLHCGLQAADLSTMHFRNGANQYIDTPEGELIDASLIDFIVHKNQDLDFRSLDKKKYEKLIFDIRDHEATQTALWRQQGIKKTYYPLENFPFEKYGYKKQNQSRV